MTETREGSQAPGEEPQAPQGDQLEQPNERSRESTVEPQVPVRPRITVCTLFPPLNPTRDQAIFFNQQCYAARMAGQRDVPQDLPIPPLAGIPNSGNGTNAQNGQGTSAQNTQGTDANGAGHVGSGPNTPRSSPEAEERRKDRETLDLIKAFELLSPSRKRKVGMMMSKDVEDSGTKDSLPSRPKKLLKLDSTDAAPTADVTASSPAILNKVYHENLLGRYYIPLTAFGNAILEEKSARPKFSYLEIYTSSADSKGKIHILDVDQFHDEKLMTIAQWHECYNNFFCFVPEFSTNRFLTRLKAHYNLISTHPKFNSLWSNFRAFDIWYRTHLIVTGKPHPETDYNSRLAAFDAVAEQAPIIQELHDKISLLEAQATSSSNSSSSSSNNSQRGQGAKKKKGGQGGRARGGRSFRDSSSSSHLCILCAGSHHLDDCTAERSAKGKSFFAKKDSSSRSGLCVRTTGASICAAWNCTRSGTNSRCGYGHDDAHVCSLCGSADHTALSRSCIEN